MKSITRRILLVTTSFAALVMSGPSWSDPTYPNKPVKIVVASAAGGILDTVARTIAQGLSQRTGQQFIVENKPGAGGIIGTEIVARATPDGYTAGKIATSHAINPYVYAKLPYDTMKDLAPVAQTVNLTNLLVVHPSVQANNLKELIALAKKEPGKLTFGSAGVGQSNHMSGEVMKQMAGIDIVHVPYKGSAPALTDLLAGNINMMFVDALSAAPHVKSGRIKVIAATGLNRSPALPEYPTLNESGLPGFNGNSWLGIVLPGSTPAPVVDKLSKDIAAVLNSPEVKQSLISKGVEPVGNSPAEFKAFIESEMNRYAVAAKNAGIKPQ